MRCSDLVCGVAVPNNEFAILGGADQKPDEKKDRIKMQNNSTDISERELYHRKIKVTLT